MRVKYKLEALGKEILRSPDKIESSKKFLNILFRRLLSGKERPDCSADWQRVRRFHDIHRGQRCFIIGNHPSLDKTDLSLLRNEYTIGVNEIFYRHDNRLFRPTYYVVEDDHLMANHLRRINEINYAVKFFPNVYADLIHHTKDTFFLPTDFGFCLPSHPYYETPRFSRDISQAVHACQTATYLNLQLAYYMGFSKVYLIGVDFSHIISDNTKIGGLTITSRNDDPNRVHPEHLGKGRTRRDPKLRNFLKVYEYARKIYEQDGREIYNATIGGKLEVFKRVDYYSLFGRKQLLEKPNHVRQCILNSLLAEQDPKKETVIIEIGSMFRVDEGESTAIFAEYANRNNPNCRVYSIDAERESLDACKTLLEGHYHLKTKSVSFLEGTGTEQLHRVFEKEPVFDLALIDGGADPKENLKEYQILEKNKKKDSFIVIDDVALITKRINYKKPRPLGKGTLIVPYVIARGTPLWRGKHMAVVSDRLSLKIMDKLSPDGLKQRTNNKRSRLLLAASLLLEKRTHNLHQIGNFGGRLSYTDASCRGYFTSFDGLLIIHLVRKSIPFLIMDRTLYVFF